MRPNSAPISALTAMVCLAVLVPLLGCSEAPPTPDDSVTAYDGGWVWNGEGFVARPLFVRDGQLVEAPEGGAGRVVDLGESWIVPPFTEAHHHVTGADAESSRQFLERGVFYALNANTVVGPFENRGDFFKRSDTYDVVLAMGGLTEPGGHPEKLYVETLTRWVYPGWTLEDFVGNAFHYVRDLEQAEAALDLLQKQGSEVVKTYLLYSEEHAERRDDETYYGLKGLDPNLYPELVQAIHRRGLRVAVHVETDHDTRVAADAGVDLFVHLPGYHSLDENPDRIRLTDDTIAAIKSSGAAVIATYVVAKVGYDRALESEGLTPEARSKKEEERQTLFAVQADNLRRIQAAGIPIVTGTDGFSTTPVDEAVHLQKIGGLSTTEALRALTRGGTALFPERRLGCFSVGCEADFLVLDADPLADLEAVRSIRLRIKAGRELDVSKPESQGEENTPVETEGRPAH